MAAIVGAAPPNFQSCAAKLNCASGTRQTSERLGMKNSGYDRNRYVIKNRASGYTRGPFGFENADYIEMDSTPGAAGALYSTVEDMFLWDRALYTDKLLGIKYRKLMFSPNRDVPEVKAAGGRPQSVYGYGWHYFEATDGWKMLRCQEQIFRDYKRSPTTRPKF